MKNGKYRLTMEVELRGMEDASEALKAIADMIAEMHDNEETPEASLELLEEIEPDYDIDEDDGVEELDFDDAA